MNFSVSTPNIEDGLGTGKYVRDCGYCGAVNNRYSRTSTSVKHDSRRKVYWAYVGRILKKVIFGDEGL